MPQTAILGFISAQFRQQMIELVQTGRNPNELAREFGCHVTSILSWVRKARLNLPAGVVPVVLPLGATERQELLELRRKVRQLQMERDILSKACVHGLPTNASRRSQRFHPLTCADQSESGQPTGTHHV